MTDRPINTRIALELYKALSKLARSDLLGIVGSYGDTLPDEEVLRMLGNWNCGRRSAARTALPP